MATARREREAEEGLEDMINLSDLNEHTILQNIKTRYGRDHIYTYIGSILVAVNPYRMFNIYGLDMVKHYEGHQIGDLPPHLFAVGSASFSKMVKEKENQVLVISGESGAGKTESTKLIMQYLAAVNKSGNNLITEQILEASPLLESFGNAKTIRNDNSSRFGKYIEVFFKDGAIVGARTLEYLLEKSRIVTQAPEERNYHVFYEMLEALNDEQKGKYGLQTAPKYFYLNQGGSSVIPGRDDAENFRKLIAAMDILDFTRDEQDTIQKILASVLHVGNVYFKAMHADDHDTVELGSDAEIRWVSHLLLLSEDWLKQALTSKVTEARGDRVVSPYNLDQALDARDAIAKALYSRLFTWLVERVNLIICRAEREKTTSLAVLDIFGFEDFHHNSFEQLCINYANETLQYFFNQHIFQLEQKEYTKEKIRWQHIEFKDNQPVIDLIATKPTGVLHILDDECNFPQSRDQSFLEKCHFHHSDNPLYEKPRMSDPEFYIVHYAGRIKYNVQHFIEKNKDTLRSDVVELMCESKNMIIAQMFGDLRDRQITKTLSKTTGRYVTLKPRTPTVAASFNESLLSLIDTMSRCHPFFVRCVKPNTTKSAMLFEDQVVSDQLRYTGMLETIRIRKMGYPIRIKFPIFIQRYRCLLRGQVIRQSQLPSEVCANILTVLGPTFKDQYQIGATKVFMKETFEIHIDGEAATIQRDAAIRIQTRARAFLARNKFLKARAASRKIQRHIRMWKSRREFLATRNGIIKAQAQFRMFLQRRRYIHTREATRHKLEEQKLARRRQEAQEKLEREQRERAARAMASITSLEVPGELAFVYSKLDDWRTVHDGGNIMATVGDVQPMDMGYRLPVDINSHPFSKYTSIYFKDPQWGVKAEPLHSPLTKIQSDEISHRALSVFKLILRCMGENNVSEKREKVLSDYIVQMGLQHEGLRDELLCQLANQTWQNQNVDHTERAWRLVANALCCFMPSPTLFKYYLKYVSDVGVNGFKYLCQHKVLQSANLEPQLSRIYPPTFLEWRAIQRKANMALEVKFPDDINIIGHVESWTSGELFASHLLKQKGVKDNTQGWTLMLSEDTERYELMGYDYALDLISEMEVAPGFPTCKAYFLVSTDRSRERLHHKRHHDGPHNAEQERILVLTGPLPEMLRRTTPVLANGHPGRGATSPTTSGSPVDDLGFSTTSVLNQRPTEIFTGELSESRMNVRYTKRRAPTPPQNGHIPNGHVNGVANGVNGDMSVITEDEDDLDLSHVRINTRYFPEGSPNGVNGSADLSGSKLNTRYAKKSGPGPGPGRPKSQAVQDQIRKKQGGGVISADVHSVTSEHSDWSHWVEDVFSSALGEHTDGESEGKSLHSRIKGGGKGVPGIQTQQNPVPPLNLGLGLSSIGLTGPTSAMAPPMMSPAFAFNTQLTPGLATADTLQQLGYQQAIQQQAAQQAAIQAILLQQDQQRQQAQQQALFQAFQQQQQQQQQQQTLAAAQVAAQHQVVSLQAALQQTELENRLLKQSIERENLRKQLQQVQHQTVSPPGSAGFSTAGFGAAGFPATSFASQQAGLISPDASFSSGMALPPGVLPSPRDGQFAHSSTESVIAGSSKVGPAVSPKRVQFIKSTFENQPGTSYASTSYGADQAGRSVGVAKSTRTVSFTTTSTVQQGHGHGRQGAVATSLFGQNGPSSPPHRAPSPPPAPPAPPAESASAEVIYTEGFTPVPPLHTQPKTPLPPPPPPPPPANSAPMGLEIDKERGTFTIRDKSGKARTVRIGKVVWPPQAEEFHKQEVQVGKLEIDEKVAAGIESRIIGKKKWQKPPAPAPIEDRPKSILKKGSEEGIQMRRAKSLVETSHIHTMKLLEGKLGGKASAETSAESSLLKSAAASQTTDTLKRAKQESFYASAIVQDTPPPPPSHPPPQLKKLRKETVEVEEKFEKFIRPDIPSSPETFERRIEEDVPQKPQIDYAAFERVITELFPQNKRFSLMYNKVPWTLHIRKEVFWPSERLENPTVLYLIYCQVVQDVYNNACIRINKDQRVKMKSMLEGYGVNKNNYLTKELNQKVKKVIVDTAKEWPTYFCRLFPVAASGHYTGVRYLGVSHTGLRLITRERNLVDDYLSVMEDVRFEDVVDVMLPNSTTIQINLRTKSLLFHTPRARQLKDMIDRFCQESEKGNKFVVAVKDYLTRESTLLSFKRGDIVKLMDPEMNLERGWMYGSLNGIVGLFPNEYVRPLARHEVETSNMKPKLYQPPQQPHTGRPPSREGAGHAQDDHSETSQGTIVSDGKFSMMEFAMLHFRESLDNPDLRHKYMRTDIVPGSSDWSWREQADMIKWTRSPIQASLLKLPSNELNKLALECFIAIMRFMGDYPMGANQTDFDCVMKILRSCHKYPELRDEVFCQLCKQTTNNRSMQGKSKIKGWRLFALVAAYCDCSETLRPFLFKYLETTASDMQRTYNHSAALCLQNLRKTFKYGGRKNVPLREEVQALADGRNCKRFPFFYSGTEIQGGLLQVKPCTVVHDAIVDVCVGLNINDPVEMEEYTLFVRTEDGVFSKLSREEYLLDLTAEFVRKKAHYDLIFQRTVWLYPLSHMDNEIYVDMMFHQCIFDYMDGLMIVWQGKTLTAESVEDMVMMGALLHRANEFVGVPTLKQLDVIVPKTLRNGPFMQPQQWLNRIQERLASVASRSSLAAKAMFLDILSRWPLFGSTIFLIKSIPNMTGECKLAVNKKGISFLQRDSHEIILQNPFSEVLSTRRYRSDSGGNYLDMKIGNLMVQKILRIETEQGSDISNLIGQYMGVVNRRHKQSERL